MTSLRLSLMVPRPVGAMPTVVAERTARNCDRPHVLKAVRRTTDDHNWGYRKSHASAAVRAEVRHDAGT
jgi:hypothetical protein